MTSDIFIFFKIFLNDRNPAAVGSIRFPHHEKAHLDLLPPAGQPPPSFSPRGDLALEFRSLGRKNSRGKFAPNERRAGPNERPAARKSERRRLTTRRLSALGSEGAGAFRADLFFQKRRNRLDGEGAGEFVRVGIVRVDHEPARRIGRKDRQEVELRHADASPKIIESLVDIAKLVVRTEQMEEGKGHDAKVPAVGAYDISHRCQARFLSLPRLPDIGGSIAAVVATNLRESEDPEAIIDRVQEEAVLKKKAGWRRRRRWLIFL